MSIFNNSDIWSCIIDKLPLQHWLDVSLTCKSANVGLNKYMILNYGHINTFMHSVPIFVNNWRCRQQNNPPIIQNVPYPHAFEDPTSTIIITSSVPNVIGDYGSLKIDLTESPLNFDRTQHKESPSYDEITDYQDEEWFDSSSYDDDAYYREDVD